MERAILLTEEQYQQVVGQPFAKGCYFNPVRDAYGRPVISFEELLAIEDKNFSWLWSCPIIKYVPPYTTNDFNI